MWAWRRMLRVPYTAHQTNVSILNELGNPKRLSSIVSTRMLIFLGHIHRSDHMEKPVVQGHAPSGRRRGRSYTLGHDFKPEMRKNFYRYILPDDNIDIVFILVVASYDPLKIIIIQPLYAAISQVYESSSAPVRIDGNLSGETATRKGVRQGCVLSPMLFNIYSEFVLDNWNGGITIGGSKISNLRFADDTTLIAASQEELIALLNILEHSSAYGLGINYNKTKVTIVDREHDNHREIKSLGRCEVVQSFVYLGSLMDNSGSCENEIRRRILPARVAMTKLAKIWRDHNITKATKMSLVQPFVFSIFLYASETWTQARI
ncbi:unnamed protein product [Callosobruchus maculatus]|uniref:Reverse transcriptase domain-containing protein n=1 Tax=Callosobruchus maculatus TaxID=64391 RepID=A0A653C4I6_CALMS|nr:unnamed protein product [Callosobruchus maculatus]